ncbi:MAG: hypothetical protein ACTSWY_10460 [Promethearchaeota archaeon]
MVKKEMDDLSKAFSEFQETNKEFHDLLIIKPNGMILFKTENIPEKMDKKSVLEIIKSWEKHKGFFNVLDIRYTILKSDPYQFCALNVKSGKSLCGSTTKSGYYAISFLTQGSNYSLLVASVIFNKWIWVLI